VHSIYFDHAHTGYLAVKHLLDLGHRRIGMLLGPPDDPGNKSRLEGFRRAFLTAGQDIDAQNLEYAEPAGGFDSCRNGYNAIKKLIARRGDLTGVVAFDDSVAIGAMRGAFETGLCVPRDLSLIGVDDSPQAEFATPPLTTVRLPTSRVGELAAEQVVQALAQERRTKPVHLKVKGELVVRESSAPPRSQTPSGR
jgi:LacI family transcriptional regulator